MDLIHFFSFLASFFAGYFGVLGGGGGGIIIFSYLITILPFHIAIGTMKLTTLGISGGIFRHIKGDNKVTFKEGFLFTFFALFFGFIGGYSAFLIDVDFLKKFIGVLLIILFFLLFVNLKNFESSVDVSFSKKIFGYIFFAIICFISGISPGGTGIIATFIFMYFFGYNFLKASFTYKIPLFFISIISFIPFAYNNSIDYLIGISCLFGGFIGGYLGGKTALKVNKIYLKFILGFFILYGAYSLLY